MKTKFVLFFSLIIITTAILYSCKKENLEEGMTASETPLTPYTISSPNYMPQLHIPADNPLTVEGIELGRKLYYDTILSNSGISCSSCHFQSYAFSNPTVNSLPHMNLAWNNKFLWIGSEEGVLENAMIFEVEDFFQTDISKLNNHNSYPGLFKRVFQTTNITAHHVAYALAQFVRTQVSINSKFDQYLRYETMLTPSEMNGFVIYNSERGDCFHCHTLGLFNDNNFHNIGIDSIFAGQNKGRYNITLDSTDLGKFKTPSLRNVELTAPYMHDGRFSTLEQVVEHYNSQVKITPSLDPILTKPNHQFGLQLNNQEKADLVAFLKTLTDTSFITNQALSNP
ncbi:MAG: c-type cytochrome [Bacteroidetes bacterium]|nr:c-type cytochrome [Bacteroidota bacterium]